FLSLKRVEEKYQATLQPPERQYDEKFHILQAPALFLQDLEYFRQKCDLRGVPVTVAFVDIDNFRDFNSRLTHEIVDRDVLPRFMQTIEASVFSKGYAYRLGGDEYLLLLPNVAREDAVTLLNRLREQLGGLKYRNTDAKTTVSIGVCVA